MYILKNIIVAYDKNRAIGYEDSLLWKRGEMPEDMRHFRELTRDSIIVMGRKTLESIGIALPERRNIVLTSSEFVDFKNVEIAHSIKDINSMIQDDDEVFYIGGGEIYNQALAEVERIYATEIDATIYPADTFFPDISQNWKAIDSKEHNADERNIYPYSFKTYEHK